MNLMIVPGMLTCSSFLINVCMFIVSKALLISSATVIFCAGEAICMFAVMLGRRLFSSVFAITERRDMGLYEVPLSMSLLLL